MYILYLDESGTGTDASHFILAGLAVFEREAHWYAQDVDAIQQRYFPDVTEPLEFHAAKLRAPQGSVPVPFDRLSREQRKELITDMLKVICSHRGVLFGVAIEKDWCKEDPYERAFEELTSRFDLFLRRYNTRAGEEETREEQRGLIVVAESSYRDRLEILGRRFRGGATRWGQVRNLAEVPFFVPASNTRLLQLADFCANVIHGRYNGGYARDFDLIARKFDRERDRIHGLTHLCKDFNCQCLACVSRRSART
jgi:hypothetical protein